MKRWATMVVLLAPMAVCAGDYGWDDSANGQAMDNWNREGEMQQLRQEQTRQFEELQRQQNDQYYQQQEDLENARRQEYHRRYGD
jgi:hypothetical protein